MSNNSLINVVTSARYNAQNEWNKFINSNQSLFEEFISRNAKLSCDYAVSKKDRFELGENAISQNPEMSLLYAQKVLGSRFELGEKAIASVTKYAYAYALSIIKGRWKPAEDKILKSEDVGYVIRYASEIIKGRWVEAEDAIKECKNKDLIQNYCVANNHRWSEVEDKILSLHGPQIIQYAEKCVKGRWKEAEKEFIKRKDHHSILNYSIKYGRWIEGEKELLSDKKIAVKTSYCAHVLGGRWKELEDILLERDVSDDSLTKRLYNYAKEVIDGKLPDFLHNKMLMIGMVRPKDIYLQKYLKAKKYKQEKKHKVFVTNEQVS